MFTPAIGFVLGMVLGSFAQAVAGRLLKNQSILGRSYCPRCKYVLEWYDLFPIFSYLFLKGKCRYCQKSISFSNLLAELSLGLVMALVFYVSVPNLEALTTLTWDSYLIISNLILNIFIVTVLAMVFITDLKEGLILDKIIFPASGLVALYLIITSGLKSWLFYNMLSSSKIGKYLLPPYNNYFTDQLQRLWLPILWAFLTGLGFSAFFIFLILITKGKGMGWGDVKYVIFLGLALGLPAAVVGIFLAFLVGAIVSLMLIVFKIKHFGDTIPFGPFLSLGAFIALLWSQQIINWYLQWF